MKRDIYTSLFAGILFLSTAFITTSCSDSTDDFVETEWNIEHFTVNSSQWSWNNSMGRWEFTSQLDFLDEFVYENGVVIGYIFFGTQDVDEVQSILPYTSKSYLLDDGSQFTETIHFAFSRLTNKITFYISPSDGVRDEDARQNYNFRVVMIW